MVGMGHGRPCGVIPTTLRVMAYMDLSLVAATTENITLKKGVPMRFCRIRQLTSLKDEQDKGSFDLDVRMSLSQIKKQ